MKRSVALLVGLVAVCAVGWFFVRDQIRLVEHKGRPVADSSATALSGGTAERSVDDSNATTYGLTLVLETSTRLTLPAGGVTPPIRRKTAPADLETPATRDWPSRLLAPVRALTSPDSPFPRPLAYLALAALIGFFVGWLHRALRRADTSHAPLTGRHPDHVDAATVSDKRAARRLKELEKQLATVGRAKAELQQSVERQLAEQRTQLDATRREALERGEQYASARQQLDDARRQLEARQTDVDQTARLQREIDELTSAADRTRKGLAERDERIGELDACIAELKDAGRGRDASLNDTATALTDVTAERDRLIDARAHDGAVIETLTAQLAELGEREEQSAGEADEHRRRADALAIELDQTRDRLRTGSDVAHALAAEHSAKVDELAGGLATLRARERELETAAAESRELADTLRRQLDEQARRNDELSAAGTADGESLAAAKAQFAGERARAEALGTELEAERASAAKLSDQLERLRATAAGDRDRAAGFSEQTQMLTAELAASHERRGELERQLDDARSAAGATRLQLAEANARVVELETAAAGSARDLEGALSRTGELESELTDSRRESNDWRERTAKLQAEHDELDAERASLVDALAERDRRLDDVATDMDERLAKIDRLEQALARQAETHRELNEAHERLRADLDAGDRAVDDLTAAVESRDARIAELSGEVAELAHVRDKLDAWDSSVTTYRNDLRDRDNALAGARDEIARLTAFKMTSHEQAAQISSLEERLAVATTQAGVRDERLARAAEEVRVLADLLGDSDATVAATNARLEATEERLTAAETDATRLAGQLETAEAALAETEARAWDLDQALAMRIDEAADIERERAAWRDRLSPLTTRVAVLARSLHQNRSSTRRLKDHVVSLDEQLDSRHAQLAARDDDVARLTDELAAARNRLDELEFDNHRLNAYEAKLNQWDSTVSTLRSDLRNRDAINDGLREQLADYQSLQTTSVGQRERIDELNARLDKQTRLAATLKRGVDSLRHYKKQAAENEQVAHGLRRELDASLHGLSCLDTRIAEQNDTLARFEAEAMHREADLADLEQTVAARDDALADASAQLAVMQSGSEALSQSLGQRDDEIARLEVQLTNQADEIDSLSGALLDAEAVAAGLEATLRERHMDIDELTGTVEAKIADLEDLKVVADGIATARDEAEARAERRAGIARELGDALDQASQQTDRLEGEVARLKDLDEKLAAWDSTVTTLREDLRQREHTIDAFLEALAGARGEPVARDAWPSAVAWLGDAASRAQLLQRELEASAQRIDTLSTQIAAHDDERRSMADTLERHAIELDNRTTQIDELIAQAGQRDNELQHATVIAHDRERRVAELSDQLESQSSAREALASQLDDRTGVVDALRAEAADRQQHIDRLAGELADWQARWRQLDDTVDRHVETIERLTDELDKKRVALQALEAQATEIASLESAARHARDKMDDLERRLERRSSEALDLEQQVADWMHRAATATSAPTLTSVVKSGPTRRLASGDDNG